MRQSTGQIPECRGENRITPRVVPLTVASCAINRVNLYSPEFEALSKDLKLRGFSFVGPTVAYAYMQAAGLVNDHLVSCFRYQEILR